jgi:zinc/manganese transport system substrate-binding protein
MTLRRHRRTSHRTTTRLASILAGTLLLAACGGAEDAAPTPQPAPAPAPAPAPGPEEPALPPLSIVVTTSILGDVVAAITGDDATVRVLMGPGVDPHVYEASAADAAAMRDADLVIANGLLLEERLVSVLEAAVEDGVRVLSVGEEVDPIEFSFKIADGHSHDHGHSHGHSHDHGHSHGDDEDHDHGDEDPHFWWDPMRMALATELIGLALTDVRPEIDWSARVATYNAELMAVHEEMVALFATIPDAKRRIITNHDSLGYLAARYDFEVIGTVIPGSTTSAATNSRDFARLVDLVVAEGVSVIFAENTDTTDLAEQLGSEAVGRGDIAVTVVRIYTDALGAPGSGAETYLGMLRTSARLITEALATA